MIVTALSHEKLPLTISHSWVTMMTAAAMPATGWGVNSRNGTTSWATWLAATSTRWSGTREVVEPPAQRAGHRLGLVVVLEAGQVAPARVAAHLDHPGAELDAEQQPADQDQDQRRRRAAVGSEEDRQEPGLEQQGLPAEGVPGLADVDDRQVHRPQRRPGQHRHDGRGAVDEPGERPARRSRRRSTPGRRRSGPSSGAWNTLGAWRKRTTRTNSGIGRIPRAPSSGRNWLTATRKAIR